MTKDKNEGLPSDTEIAEAKREGVLDRVREGATTQELDPIKGEDPKGDRYIGKHEIMQWAHYVDFDLEALEAALDPKADNAIPDNKVAGLLGLERGGKNRTAFVEAYMKRLRIANPGVKIGEVTNAGPGYTNDVSSITKIDK